MPTIGFPLVGLTCATLIAMALRPGSTTQRLFRLAFLRFFGRYSYGIYVFHYPIEGAVSHPLRRLLASHLHSKALAVLGDSLVVGALFSYHLFEIQFLRLKRFFAYTRADNARYRASEATPAA